MRASALINRTISHCQVGILQPAHSQYAHFYHSPSCDAHNPAIEQIGWFGIQTFIGMVREFTGRTWQPLEIGVMTECIPRLDIREKFWNTRIQLSQPYSYIALENSQLSLPPSADKTAAPVHPTSQYEALSSDFVGSFKQLLHAYIQEKTLNIEVAAGLCDLSKRSLQRELTAQGASYSSVLDEVRFEVAKRMLLNPDSSVTDIAHLLGYSEATHFARAFRRIAGVNPRIYRQQYRH